MARPPPICIACAIDGTETNLDNNGNPLTEHPLSEDTTEQLSWMLKLKSSIEHHGRAWPTRELAMTRRRLVSSRPLRRSRRMSRVLCQAIALKPMLDDVDDFDRELGELKRRWQIPEIRKKMRELIIPLVEKEFLDIGASIRKKNEAELEGDDGRAKSPASS